MAREKQPTESTFADRMRFQASGADIVGLKPGQPYDPKGDMERLRSWAQAEIAKRKDAESAVVDEAIAAEDAEEVERAKKP